MENSSVSTASGARRENPIPVSVPATVRAWPVAAVEAPRDRSTKVMEAARYLRMCTTVCEEQPCRLREDFRQLPRDERGQHRSLHGRAINDGGKFHAECSVHLRG
jgi:hypothetical protein